MKAIPLTRGYAALVDDEDYERVAKFKWQVRIDKSKSVDLFYAQRTVRVNGKKTTQEMHRLIMGFPPSGVDHQDCDGLNNQKYNLRPASQEQNVAYARTRVGGTSTYKGVSFCSRTGKWVAQICKKGKRCFIGRFKEEADAATAYNFKAFEFFGEFARFNIPMEPA